MEDLHPSPQSDNTNLSSPGSNSQYYEKVLVGGKKMFKCLCEGCGKTFRFKSDMERHVVIHTNTRPYMCSHPGCNKTFKRPDALKSHMQTHNEEVLLDCPIPGCNAQFQKKSALQYHILKHQKPNHFVCTNENCNQTFTSFNDLKQHQKKSCTGIPKKNISPKSDEKKDEQVFVFDLSEGSSNDLENFSWEEIEEEDFNFEPTKGIHKEDGTRVTLQKQDSFDFSENSAETQSVSAAKKDSESASTIHNLCKQLLYENAKLKKELEDKMNSIQSRFGHENRINSLFSHALDLEVEEFGSISQP